MQNGKRTRSKILNLRIYTLTYSRRNFLECKPKELLIFFVQENAIFKMKVGKNNNESLSKVLHFYNFKAQSIIECYYTQGKTPC